ncbi:unnamed protein product [Didymodactylos carnosus]|uniref:Kinesin motor domain-containing protein n=1 Tax=Didymodactylos carnosus TaxID=1234261 RepID=A0A813YMT6_9BILA|nr:unnamed protein product [Didymodactylos carnosus]CAF1244344.1 unnamed protein product [Didymodactylos carnosus]CAF3671446.1 unnamed protein product [Didymodactylos carnosus]CAF4051887.1 unnamed protein product [Didymodactylos carnosus]
MDNTNDDTTTSKQLRRKEPPFLVYLRFRPFIADEIAKGENQQTIEVLDEKRVGIKIYPTIASQIRSVQSSYNEYEVTRVFNENCTQQEFYSSTFEIPTNEVFEGSNWLLFTMGLSNSGKTHTMFGTEEKPGIIPQCFTQIFHYIGSNIDNNVVYKPAGLETYAICKQTDLNQEIASRDYIFEQDRTDERRMKLPKIVQKQSLDDLSLQDEYYSVWISFFELYNEHIYDLLVRSNEIKSRKPLRLLQGDSTTTIRNLIQVPVFDLEEAKDVVKYGFINRSTSKTVFNEASSRSHAILCITLITTDEFSEQPTMSHLYICDLAGNEPSTQHAGKQMNETCNINTSLMTLKDCIRVLNENQKANVLTSIFRPFFCGVGHISIVVNVNPCASFTSQTNDLLKFASLAQKTTIVQCEPIIAKAAPAPSSSALKYAKSKNLKRLTGSKVIPVLRNKANISSKEEEFLGEQDDENLISYWRKATDAALKLLQKQATWRRSFMIERHDERVKLVGGLMQQRDTIKKLNADISSLNEQITVAQIANVPSRSAESIRLLTEKTDEYSKKIDQLQRSYAEILKQNDEIKTNYNSLKDQCVTMENGYKNEIIQHLSNESKLSTQIEQMTVEHGKEMARMKRELNLEVYRKQDFEKRLRVTTEKLESEIAECIKQKKLIEQKHQDHQQTLIKCDNLQIELCRVRNENQEEIKEFTDKYEEQKKLNEKIFAEKEIWKQKYEMMIGKLTEMEAAANATVPQQDDTISIRSRLKRQTNEINSDETDAKKPKRVTRSSSRNNSASSDENNSVIQLETRSSKKKISTRQKKNSQINETASSRVRTFVSASSIKTNQDFVCHVDEIDRFSKLVKQIQTEIEPRTNKKTTAVVRARQNKQQQNGLDIGRQYHPQTPTVTHSVSSAIKHSVDDIIPVVVHHTVAHSPMLTTVQRTPSHVSTYGHPSAEQSLSTPKQSTTFKGRLQSLFRHTPSSAGSIRVNRFQTKTAVAFGSSTPTSRVLQPIHTPQAVVPPVLPKVQTPRNKYNLRNRFFSNPSYKDEEVEEKPRPKKGKGSRK